MKELLERVRKMLEMFYYGQPIKREELIVLFTDIDSAIAEYGEIEVELHAETYKIDCTDEEHTDMWVIIGGDFVLSVKDEADGKHLARSLNGKVLRYEENV